MVAKKNLKTKKLKTGKNLFIKLNKPIINGMCVLDISKVLMYTFIIKP